MKILKVDVETKEVPDYGMVMHVPVMEQIMAKSTKGQFPDSIGFKEEVYTKELVGFGNERIYYYVRQGDKKLFTDLITVTKNVFERQTADLEMLLYEKDRKIRKLLNRNWWERLTNKY